MSKRLDIDSSKLINSKNYSRSLKRPIEGENKRRIQLGNKKSNYQEKSKDEQRKGTKILTHDLDSISFQNGISIIAEQISSIYDINQENQQQKLGNVFSKKKHFEKKNICSITLIKIAVFNKKTTRDNNPKK